MPTNISIEGANYTDLSEGLEAYDIIVSENSSNTITRSISKEITLKNEGYELIKDKFFSTCNGFMTELQAELRVDLCGETVFSGKITSEGIKLDNDNRKATVFIKGDSVENSAYVKLGQDYIFDNGFKESIDHPLVYFTKQNYTTGLMLLLRIAIESILYPVALLSKGLSYIVYGICKVADIFGDLDCKNPDEFDIIENLTEKLDDAITGNGSYVPVILIREAIEYQCRQNGIEFASSILNNPSSSRYNLALFSIEGSKAGHQSNTTKEEIQTIFGYNAPLLTTFGLLESIKEMFNADYKIIGKTLYFEEVEFFDKYRQNEISINRCAGLIYSYNTSDLFAYADIGYEADPYDQESVKLLNGYYREKLEFNNPPREAQKGVKSIQLKYSPLRHMYDQETADRNGFFDLDLIVDNFKSGSNTSVNLFGVNVGKNKGILRQSDPILTSEATGGYKLIVLDEDFDRKDAKIIKRFYKTRKAKCYEYNYPIYVKEDSIGSLSNFLYKLNPRLTKKALTCDPITIDCDCDAIDLVLKAPYTVYVDTEFGKAIPKDFQIKIDHAKNSAQLVMSNFHILCN